MRSAAVVLIALCALAAPARADRKWFDPAAVYNVPTGDSARHGPDDALVTIVEWSDYACKFCNRVQRTLEHIERLYAGKVRWVYRHLPLDPEETLAAEAGLAARAQGAFWPMHDRLFALHGQVDRASVELIAEDLGLDMARFRGDLDGHVYRDEVLADARDANNLGVTGTPTFFVNGRPLRGAQPLGVFVRVIDEEMARANEALAKGAARDGLYEKLVVDGSHAADSDAEEQYGAPQLDPSSVYRVGLGLAGHSMGPADALVTVVVWSDFQCPYCGVNAPSMAKLREEYGDQVRVVYRHLPLPMHPDADLAAEAAVAAAAQGKFWAMHDRLFADQRHLARADLEAAAEAIGLDMKAFRAALDDRRYRDAVADDNAAGAALGITGTPTLFVNGAPIEGAPRYDQLKMIVELRLAEAQSLVANGIAPRDVYGVIMATADGAERGDPSRMPRNEAAGKLELRMVEREAAVEAACRSRDGARAEEMAGRLKGDARASARTTCEAYGIDLK
jgi:protein-disulfide isomerase